MITTRVGFLASHFNIKYYHEYLDRLLFRTSCTLANRKAEQCADGPISPMDNLVDFTRYSVIAPCTLRTRGFY